MIFDTFWGKFLFIDGHLVNIDLGLRWKKYIIGQMLQIVPFS